MLRRLLFIPEGDNDYHEPAVAAALAARAVTALVAAGSVAHVGAFTAPLVAAARGVVSLAGGAEGGAASGPEATTAEVWVGGPSLRPSAFAGVVAARCVLAWQ
jgi:hypothetical protein